MKPQGKCKTPYCRNRRAKDARFCARCKSRHWRKKNPVKAAYLQSKGNAKRRGISFNWSFEDFSLFCSTTNYINDKGIKSYCATIDRVDPLKGYEPGNVQVLQLSDNVRKMHVYYSENGRRKAVNYE